MPTDDDGYGPGSIRADGRKMHAAYLLEAKKPSESKRSFEAGRHHPGGRSLPPVERKRLPMGEEGLMRFRGRG